MNIEFPSLARLAPVLALLTASMVGVVSSGAQAETVRTEQALPAVVRYTVVDHNIEKKGLNREGKALDQALNRAAKENADAITLQEVCAQQFAALDEAYGDRWTLAYNPLVPASEGKCKDEDSANPNQSYAVGDVVIWTGGTNGEIGVFPYDAQPTNPQLAGRSHGATCITYLNQVRFRVCTTKLIASESDTRNDQGRELRDLTAPWVAADQAVILTGDFNAVPESSQMDRFYRFQGTGKFRELHVCGGQDCRDGQITAESGDGYRRKIDYIFMSYNRLPASANRQLFAYNIQPETSDNSDHKVLYGYGYLTVN